MKTAVSCNICQALKVQLEKQTEESYQTSDAWCEACRFI